MQKWIVCKAKKNRIKTIAIYGMVLLFLCAAIHVDVFAEDTNALDGLSINVEDGAYYNTDKLVNFTFPDRDNIVATVDSPIDSQDGELKPDFTAHDEGEYTLTFRWKNITKKISFVIDKTPPVIKIGSKVFKAQTYGNLPIDGGTFKINITPEVYDEMTSVKATISKNGGEPKTFDSGYLLDEVANYEIYAIDKAGNTKVVSFYVEDVQPVITVEEFNTVITTRPITIYASTNEGTFSSTGNFSTGMPIQSVTTTGEFGVSFEVTYNGNQKITKNIASTTFSYIHPVTSSKNTEYAAVETNIDNRIYKDSEEVKISVPTGATATLDGAVITDGKICTEGGNHVLILTNGTLTNTVKFAIDRTIPNLAGAAEGVYYKETRNIFVAGGYASYTLNGEDQGQILTGETVSEDGHYVINAVDFAGYTTTLTFDIDRFPPTVDDTPGTGGMVFGIGTVTKYSSSRYIDITSDSSIASVEVNGLTKSIKADCYLIAYPGSETSYYFNVKDKAGNMLYFTVILDSRYATVTGIESNGVYNTAKVINFENSTATIRFSTLGYYDAINAKTISIKSGYEASADGYYLLTLTNTNKVETNIRFHIDTTPPTVKYNGKKFDGGIYKVNSLSLDISGHTNAQLLRNGVAVSDWNQNKSITEEGKYDLYVSDEVNKLNIQFVIDRTPPIIEGVLEGWTYTAPVAISFTDLLSGTSGTLNGKMFASGTTINTNGYYTISVSDSAGNITTRTFHMAIPGAKDETGATTPNPTTPVSNLPAPPVSGVEDGKLYKTAVTPAFADATALLNGEDYVAGTPITADGEYSLDVFGTNGGMTSITFYIDRAAPVITVKTSAGKLVKAGAVASGTVKVTVKEANVSSITVTKNGKVAAFGTGSFKFKAKYVITVTDKAGNKTVTTFTIK